MNIGMYATTSQLEAMSKNQDIIAQNLANANTAGYKKSVASFETLISVDPDNNETSTTTINVNVDYTPGKFEYTGSDFDLAIKGEGFFTIQTDNGLVYTRKGNFIISPDMEIVTPDGNRLLARNGSIQIPPDTKKILVDASGLVSADGREVGKLKITKFPDLSSLIQYGGSSFKPDDPANIGEDARDFQIAQGYIERSNVNVIAEMVNMIANMRSYQMGQKTITNTLNDTLSGLLKLAAQAG